jgi:hypothetical protein
VLRSFICLKRSQAIALSGTSPDKGPCNGTTISAPVDITKLAARY